MIEYRVIAWTGHAEGMTKIAMALDSGWALQGGLAITSQALFHHVANMADGNQHIESQLVYAQALTKETP